MKKGILTAVLAVACLLGVGASSALLFAQDNQQSDGFSLQVTPSPIISTIEPGKNSEIEFKVKNGSAKPEKLKLELKSFEIDSVSTEVQIKDETPSEVKDFVSFSEPEFTAQPGEWFTQKLRVNTPRDAGFTYNFVILISRASAPEKVEGGSALEGSVAIFTLLSINRPDAIKKLEITSFSSPKKLYEYAPAKFDLVVKNTGNTFVQPEGNIFIGRSANEKVPISVIQINPGNGYTIPGSSRTLNSSWEDGFPRRNDKGDLIWDWSKLSQIRLGKYTAVATVVYDDGQRDNVVTSTLSFWIIPWKILLGILLFLIILLVGIYTILKKSFGAFNGNPKKRLAPKASEYTSEKTSTPDIDE